MIEFLVVLLLLAVVAGAGIYFWVVLLPVVDAQLTVRWLAFKTRVAMRYEVLKWDLTTRRW